MNRRKFRILKRDGEWLLLEPGFLHVACHKTDSFEEMAENFRHILKAEQVKVRSSR